VIDGVPQLYGAAVEATDLRGAAALVVAGLCAEGKTELDGVKYLDRGYEHFEQALTSLGADIKRI
jgi:UDP-N-acetylglucosamine 1-carboxyvinyltransferase